MHRLLVIDDEVTFRTAVVHQLQDLQHAVEVADDVKSGIEAFANALEAGEPFDGVLTDMLMPRSKGFPADGEAGLMVVEGVQQLCADTVILVMTAHGSIENAVNAVRLGAYDYLTKPFTPEELQFRLSKALSHRALQRALAEQRQREQQRLKSELEQAGRIQQYLIPNQPPEISGLSIAGSCEPAAETSGDFFTYFASDAPQGQIGVAVADVCGKSLQAAMVGMMAHGMLIQTVADGTGDLAETLSHLNTQLTQTTEPSMYVCLGLVFIDLPKRQLSVACAGLWPPVVWRNGQPLSLKGVGGMPLGALGSSQYQATSVDIQEGDIIVFYSDGLVEAENEAEAYYGEGGLMKCLRQLKTQNADEILGVITADLTEFRGSALVSDDVTTVVMVVEG